MSALVRELGGNFGLLAGVLIVVIATTSYRRGEKWAWYALWILPLHASLDMATVEGYGALSMASATWDIALVLSTILALLLPYRRFFPRSES